jgi:hypothetical protein
MNNGKSHAVAQSQGTLYRQRLTQLPSGTIVRHGVHPPKTVAIVRNICPQKTYGGCDRLTEPCSQKNMGMGAMSSAASLNIFIEQMGYWGARLPRALGFHPVEAAVELLLHFRGGGVVAAAMAGEYPFKGVVGEALHRFYLGGPGVPAGVAEGD